MYLNHLLEHQTAIEKNPARNNLINFQHSVHYLHELYLWYFSVKYQRQALINLLRLSIH